MNKKQIQKFWKTKKWKRNLGEETDVEKQKRKMKARLNRKEEKKIPIETQANEERSLNLQLLGFSGQL